MNTQPISKPVHTADGTLEVHSIFQTIQGEGPFCGKPAVFVRLWGCNLQCPGCDTEYTNTRTTYTPQELLEKVNSAATKGTTLVVITGGEPLRQNLTSFVVDLLDKEYSVQIETNGTLPLSDGLGDWVEKIPKCYPALYVVCSPKAGKVNPKLHKHIMAYKYVADTAILADGLPRSALGHPSHPFLARPHSGFVGTIYLQPMDAHDDVQSRKNLHACVESVLENGYTLQVQTHKLIGVE